MITSTVTGNLGNDPELRYSAGGSPFLRFNVASNHKIRTPEGEWQDATEWVRVTVLGQRAESLANNLKKGQRVCAIGRMEARPWTDNQGAVRAGLELVASEIDFMSPRQDAEPRPDQQRAAGYPSRGPASPQAQNRQAERRMPEAMAVRGAQGQRRQVDDDLDDLPF